MANIKSGNLPFSPQLPFKSMTVFALICRSYELYHSTYWM